VSRAKDSPEDERLHVALERWIRRDKRYQELTRAVREAQRALRKGVGDEGWTLYLALEERMNARHVEVIAAAVRLASAQGNKKRRTR
jgi:hypothetical protein